MKNIISIILIVAFSFVSLAKVSFARDDEDAINKLSSFKATHKKVEWARVAQDTKFAANVKKNIIPKIKLPSGFKIELFAVVPDARNMAISRNKGAVWIGTRKDKQYRAGEKELINIINRKNQISEFNPDTKNLNAFLKINKEDKVFSLN